jgi:hypothetical protein
MRFQMDPVLLSYMVAPKQMIDPLVKHFPAPLQPLVSGRDVTEEEGVLRHFWCSLCNFQRNEIVDAGVMLRREGKAFAGFVCRENSLSSMIQRDFTADLYAQGATGLVLAHLANQS